MKSAVEKLSPTRAKLTIEVTYAEFEPSMKAAYKKIGQQVQVPGFRKGKVPARIIDQRFGRGTVLQEAINECVPQFYSQAITEGLVEPLGQPELDVLEVPANEGDDLKFTIEVDCVPEIELPETEGIEIEVDAAEVTDEEVDAQLEQLRARFGTLTGVDRAAKKGDFTSIDIRATIDGDEIDSVEGVSYEIGSGTMLEGLDDALVGLKAGKSKDFVAPLAGGEHEGKEADVTVTLQSVKERELPEVDDEFASMASEFDTVDELMASLREGVEKQKIFGQGVQARDKILEQLLEKIDVEVPQSLIDDEVQKHLANEGREGDEAHAAEVAGQTRTTAAQQFIMDALVKKYEVDVEQSELVEYIMMMAQQYGMDPNQFAQMLDAQGQVPAMVGEVRRRKALAHVLETAVITDTNGNEVDLSVLDEDEEGEDDGDDKPAKKSTAKKTTAKKTAAKKSTAKKTTAKKTAAKKDDEKKDDEKPAKKTAAKKSTASKSTAKKTTAKKTTAKKTAAKKSTAKKATAKKSTARKTTAKKKSDD